MRMDYISTLELPTWEAYGPPAAIPVQASLQHTLKNSLQGKSGMIGLPDQDAACRPHTHCAPRGLSQANRQLCALNS
jgi:hypothetical protein